MATPFQTAVGRRKTAIASVRLAKADKSSVHVNGMTPKEYFKTDDRVRTVLDAFQKSETSEHFAITAHVEGGGISAQADALRHAISRAIVKSEPGTRKALKGAGFLKRDPRAKERKKPGLKKARKSPQWSKR